ncbi:MAG: DUF4118 domain-containing protein [Candidatus Saccharibacteria bacterium]|nr:DUF4118 domain-containing protein [Pseudorhodobacter sp.]
MTADPLKDEPEGLPPAPRAIDLSVTLAIVGMTAGAAFWGQVILPADMVPLMFMLAVLIAALAFGFWAGLMAAITAFGALNFLFTDPLFTFDVARLHDLTALVMFLIVAGLAGLLAGRLHDQAEAARARAEVLGVLSDLSSALAAARTAQDALTVALRPLEQLCGGAALILTQSGAGPSVLLPLPMPLDPATQAAAERAFRTGQGQPAAAPGWPGSRYSLLPLTDGLLVGHAALSGREASRRALAIGALVQQTRLALQRLDFAAKAEAERLRAEAEATRAAVLTSLGHDLRTPLATILGAASALKDLDAQLSPAARHDLLLAIEEEAGRLNAHVSNLMQLSRLELSAPPRLDWVDLNDSVAAATTRARRAVKGAQVQETLASLPMIRSTGGLIEQAVFNLIDNALTHGRGAVQIATHAAAGACTVTVRDHGPGLPPAVSDWLAGPDARPAPGQRGLGLAVAKGVARHLGGSLSWTDGAMTLTLPEAP